MPVPKLARKGNSLGFTWDEYQLAALVSNLIEEKDGTVKGQLKWTTTNPSFHSHLLQQSFNFSSPRARSTLKTEMLKKYPESIAGIKVDWDSVLEQLSTLTIEQRNEGAPVEELWTDGDISSPEYKLFPILPEGEPTIMFADGGSGKSYIANYIALCITLPWLDNPLKLKPKMGNVLILDYETGGNTVRYRLQRILRGHSLAHIAVNYRRCLIPLCKEIDKILPILTEKMIDTVIIDSAFGACDGDLNENATAKNFFQAVRLMPATTLILHHVAKNIKGSDKSAYGSAYFKNAVRSSWELVADSEPGDPNLKLALFNRKANNSMLHKPIGVEIDFIDPNGPVTFRRIDAEDNSVFTSRMSVSKQIEIALLKSPLSTAELSEAIGETENKIRVYCSRLKKDSKIMRLANDKWGAVAQGF